MKKVIFAAVVICVVVMNFAACGGKKKDSEAKMPASDAKTSATSSYDPGTKHNPIV